MLWSGKLRLAAAPWAHQLNDIANIFNFNHYEAAKEAAERFENMDKNN